MRPGMMNLPLTSITSSSWYCDNNVSDLPMAAIRLSLMAIAPSVMMSRVGFMVTMVALVKSMMDILLLLVIEILLALVLWGQYTMKCRVCSMVLKDSRAFSDS